MIHKFLHFFELILGKLFFNSFNVLRLCLTDKFFIKTYNVNIDPSYKEMINDFDEYGYSKLNKINPENLYHLKKHINNNCPKLKPKNYVHYFDTNNEALKKTIKKIIDIDLKDCFKNLDKYYKKKIFISNIVMRRTFSISGDDLQNEYFNNFFHIDSYLRNHFKIFILLSDVDNHCGPTEVFDFESSKKICKKNGIFSKRGFLNCSGYKSFKNIGFSGDVFLCNTSKCLHRATVPKGNNFRDILVFTLCAYPNKNNYFSRFGYEKNFSSSVWERNSVLTKKLAKPHGYTGLYNFIKDYKNG